MNINSLPEISFSPITMCNISETIMGPTDGRLNQYPRKGFLRPKIKEFDRKDRNHFNLKGCQKEYLHHYDGDGDNYTNNEVIVREKEIVIVEKDKNIMNENIIKKNYLFILSILIFIGVFYKVSTSSLS